MEKEDEDERCLRVEEETWELAAHLRTIGVPTRVGHTQSSRTGVLKLERLVGELISVDL